jgi:hypothetical protein
MQTLLACTSFVENVSSYRDSAFALGWLFGLKLGLPWFAEGVVLRPANQALDMLSFDEALRISINLLEGHLLSDVEKVFHYLSDLIG